MPEATPTERGTDMIKAVIDRFEGEYAVAEISCSEEIFFIDILNENFESLPCEGDVIAIESVNGALLSCKDGYLTDSAHELLGLLCRPVICVIQLCPEETGKRKERIDALSSELFED